MDIGYLFTSAISFSPRPRNPCIPQPSLQSAVAVSLNSSQWKLSRRYMCHFQGWHIKTSPATSRSSFPFQCLHTEQCWKPCVEEDEAKEENKLVLELSLGGEEPTNKEHIFYMGKKYTYVKGLQFYIYLIQWLVLP